MQAVNNISKIFQGTNQSCSTSNISQSIEIQQRARNRNNQKFRQIFQSEKRDVVSEKYLLSKFKKRIKEQQSCLYLDQISASSGFVRNTLQKTCRRNKFLASMCLFKLVCLCESYRVSETCCAWQWWWWIVFVVWLIDESHLALLPARVIVRDPHHRESPTCREQDVNHGIPRRHEIFFAEKSLNTLFLSPYTHIISFTDNEKEIARYTHLEPSQTKKMELFYEKS